MDPVITAKDIYKRYPGFPPVLRGVNIQVEPGEMVAIMGPSGCGKSTMLHVLGMLHAPDSGSLDILGQNVLGLNSEQTAAFRRGNMGFVMQASNLFEHSTVFENVEFPLIYENVPPQERWERVIRALELVRLSGRVHYRSNRLSGGEQQRVAIARAMVNNPRILLADEPTGALDARTSKVIMENFQRLCHAGGVAMIMVTHDPNMAEYCDSIYTLEDGLLVCKKHEPPKLSLDGATNFLQPPPPLVRGALVAWRFPVKGDQPLLELANRLHAARLLSRIYALHKTSLFADTVGYSLPLVVRRIGLRQRLAGIGLFFKRARTSVSPGDLWRVLPKKGSLRRKFQGFMAGVIIARWALTDDLEFLYAAGGRLTIIAAWAGARLVRRPFAITIRPKDIADIGPDCPTVGADAAFISCSTEAFRQSFHKYAPDIPMEKVLLVPNPPLLAVKEDYSPAIRAADKAFGILAAGTDERNLKILLGIARELKSKGLDFKITIIGSPGPGLRWYRFRCGLGKLVIFKQAALDDSVAECYRDADIFIAWPDKGPGMQLALPWQLEDAMAFGLSIIAMDISPGMSILKKDENCLEATDSKTLLEAIMKLASNRKLAAELGRKAHADIWAWVNSEETAKIIADRIVMAAAEGDYGHNRKVN